MRLLKELPLAGDDGTYRIGGSDLCDLLRISPAALTGLVKRDLAVKLGHDAYDLTETVGRYVEHLRGVASGRGDEGQVLTLTGERARLAREQADAQALKNAKLRGELVEASEVERTWSDTLRQMRARLMAIPSRLRADLPNLDPEVLTALDRALRDTLTELADNAD
ncbi:MAG: terminase small subunit [Mameliella sp.]|nr:terminase small subunit [Mameliella sp.]